MKYKFDKMYYNLTRILTRQNVYEVKFMLRASQSFEVMDILGPFPKKAGNGFLMPTCDPDTSFSYTIRINETLKNEAKHNFQLVVLYINNFNQRFLRIFNYTLVSTTDISNIIALTHNIRQRLP